VGEGGWLAKANNWARRIKQNLFVLYLSYKDARVPWYAKLFAVCVVAYAFSPIDLIPDFIPVLGYLDDIIIVPLGVKLALAMIPESVLADCREKAAQLRQGGKPVNWITGALFICVWLALAAWIGILVYRWL
jgi:uncharacterized membrane protein YkvA (DUF1232 family)